MAVKTVAEIMEGLKGILGDNTSDDVLVFTENLSDTLNANNDGTDWKTRYEENDANWRKKYRDRFFNSPADSSDPDEDNESSGEDKKLTFESLFKED